MAACAGQLAALHVLLDRRRQFLHQRQSPAHPARRAREAPAQILQRQGEPHGELVQQPPLLQRRRALAGAHQPVQDQRLGLAQIPARDGHQVLPEPAQRPHALVAVHQHERLGPLARARPPPAPAGRSRPATPPASAPPPACACAASRSAGPAGGARRSRRPSPHDPRPRGRRPRPIGSRGPRRTRRRARDTLRAWPRRGPRARRRRSAARGVARAGAVGALPGSLARLIRWPRRRVSGRPRPRGTPMRHLSPRLAAHEVLLLPSLVIGPPRFALLVLRARPLHPLAAGHRRARRAVDVAPVTGAADPHRHPASRAREPPRLGRRHRPGVPRALQVPPRTRSSIRLAGPSRHRDR